MKSLPRKRRERSEFYEERDVASCTEATGLIPALPRSEGGRRSLLELYSIRDVRDRSGRPR